jgi:hypothetical protein
MPRIFALQTHAIGGPRLAARLRCNGMTATIGPGASILCPGGSGLLPAASRLHLSPGFALGKLRFQFFAAR